MQLGPNNFNLQDHAKKLIDQHLVAFNKFLFFLVFRTGNDVHTYAMVPQDHKVLQQVINKTLAQYEEQFGPIPSPPGAIPSPIDVSDLGGRGNGKGSHDKKPKD